MLVQQNQHPILFLQSLNSRQNTNAACWGAQHGTNRLIRRKSAHSLREENVHMRLTRARCTGKRALESGVVVVVGGMRVAPRLICSLHALRASRLREGATGLGCLGCWEEKLGDTAEDSLNYSSSTSTIINYRHFSREGWKNHRFSFRICAICLTRAHTRTRQLD